MARRDAVAALAGGGKRAKPAKVATVHSCPAKGLCKVCGWEGHRVPVAWLEEPPGTRYEGASKLLGKRVQLRGDAVESTVVALATPLGGSLLQGNRSKAYRCQGSYIVKTPFGAGSIETPVPKSVVRERRREREGLCPDAQVYSSADLRAGAVRAFELDAARLKKAPFDLVGELPFPHRKGGSPCCINSPLHPDRLGELVTTWLESGDEPDFERAATAVRKALPRDKRATVPAFHTKADLERGVRAVKDHCWELWLTAEERAQETAKQYRARKRVALEERRAMGLDAGRKLLRQSRSTEAAEPGRRERLAQSIEEFRTWRPTVELPDDFEEVF